jgi:allantoin racemase
MPFRFRRGNMNARNNGGFGLAFAQHSGMDCTAMKLLLINGNTNAAITDRAAAHTRALLPRLGLSGTVVGVTARFGAHYIATRAASAIAQHAVLDALAEHGAGHDGIIIACFGDPGLDAAREATDAPVLGIAEAAFHAASMLATGFSVVTTMTRTCIIAEHLVHKYGFERRCRGIHGTDIPVLALESAGPEMLAQIEAAARLALERDRSGAIVLGCAGMAALTRELQQRLGVPVIDGVAAAVKFAEALGALGLRTSKRGDYATPLPKRYTGWAQPLGW